MTEPLSDRRNALMGVGALGLSLALGACGDDSGGSGTPALQPAPSPGPSPTPTPATAPRSRTWRMGFSPNPPRYTVEAVVQGIDRWSQRAELAIVHEDLPWADLLAGMSPDAILARDKVELVNYLRGKGLSFSLMLDLTNGLAREEEADALKRAGRSLREPAVQALARQYALAVQARLNPEFLGLAAETNLIRAAAPAALYQAVKAVANATDAALRNANAASRRFVSIQAETAWGRLGGNGSFAGIDQDFADFPFTQLVAISSYPYFAYPDPADIPADYYTRLKGTRTLPAIVVEGGWTSASVGSVNSSPEKQARYIARHADLLDSVEAIGYIQLQFADIDLAAFPPPVPANLPLFTAIGLTGPDFAAKPALAQWDALFARPRR